MATLQLAPCMAIRSWETIHELSMPKSSVLISRSNRSDTPAFGPSRYPAGNIASAYWGIAVILRAQSRATNPMACKIDSGVAGASSRTGRPGARLWMASAMAANTEIANISGGSPTALDR